MSLYPTSQSPFYWYTQNIAGTGKSPFLLSGGSVGIPVVFESSGVHSSDVRRFNNGATSLATVSNSIDGPEESFGESSYYPVSYIDRIAGLPVDSDRYFD
jgi:hypothetical protein